MAQKNCRCMKDQSEEESQEEFIECPFFQSEGCPCHPRKCIIYEIYDNSESTYAAMKRIIEDLKAR